MATEKQINYVKSLIDNKRIGEHAWVVSFWNAVESSAIANDTVSALIDWLKYANNSNTAKLFSIVTLDANMQALGKLIASRANIEMMVEDGLTLEMVPGFVAQYVEETEIGIVPLRGFGNKVEEFVAAFVPATVEETTYEITTDLIESEPATLDTVTEMQTVTIHDYNDMGESLRYQVPVTTRVYPDREQVRALLTGLVPVRVEMPELTAETKVFYGKTGADEFTTIWRVGDLTIKQVSGDMGGMPEAYAQPGKYAPAERSFF